MASNESNDSQDGSVSKTSSNKRWSSIKATSWESKFLTSIFFKLDHHLTWDPSFHIENDQEIYTKFKEWTLGRQFGSICRNLVFILLIEITVAILVFGKLMANELYLITAITSVSRLCELYIIYKQYTVMKINQKLQTYHVAVQNHVRGDATRSSAKDLATLNQAIDETNTDGNGALGKSNTFVSKISFTGFNREKLSKAALMNDPLSVSQANRSIVIVTLLPLAYATLVCVPIDILIGTNLFVEAFMSALSIFVLMRISFISNESHMAQHCDLILIVSFNLSLVFETFFHKFDSNSYSLYTWDVWVAGNIVIIFIIISARYHYKKILGHLFKEFKRKNELLIERYKTEQLFGSILPREILNSWRIQGAKIPMENTVATVAFIKIKVYNKDGTLCDNVDEFVKALHTIVKRFDKIIFLHRHVRKIEHVADTYLLCSGMFDDMSEEEHAQLMVHAAIALQEMAANIRLARGKICKTTIGINTGQVVGTVIGSQRKFFRIFGDTVNTTARICSTGIPHRIQLSQTTHSLCRNLTQITFKQRGPVKMKGKGEQYVFLLENSNVAHSQNKTSLSQKFQRTNHIQNKRQSEMHLPTNNRVSMSDVSSTRTSHVSQSTMQSRRSGGPRWMVEGSIMSKANQDSTSNVYCRRFEEITHQLSYHLLSLKFKKSDNCKEHKSKSGTNIYNPNRDLRASLRSTRRKASIQNMQQDYLSTTQDVTSNHESSSSRSGRDSRRHSREISFSATPRANDPQELHDAFNTGEIEIDIEGDLGESSSGIATALTAKTMTSTWTHYSPNTCTRDEIQQRMDQLEEEYQLKYFYKRIKSKNWYLLTILCLTMLFLIGQLILLLFSIVLLVFSISTIILCCTYYFFRWKQQRYLTNYFQSFTLIFASISIFESLILIHETIIASSSDDYSHKSAFGFLVLNTLFVCLFCASLSNLPYIESTITQIIIALSFALIFAIQNNIFSTFHNERSTAGIDSNNNNNNNVSSITAQIFGALLCTTDITVYVLITIWFRYCDEYKARDVFIIDIAFENDQSIIGGELSTVLPGFVIDRMRNGRMSKKTMILDRFRHACVFQSDLVGFTAFSAKQSENPQDIVGFLHSLYLKLDRFVVKYGLEKIDTIGDAYICVNFHGTPDPVLSFAHTIVTKIEWDKNEIGMRMGIATGKIIGTVLGETSKRYAVFGPALDESIYLESKSTSQKILCCPETQKRASKWFHFDRAQDIDKNNTTAFWLVDRTRIREF